MRSVKWVLPVLAIAFLVSPVMAGIGVHLGFDMTTIPTEVKTFKFAEDLPDVTPSALTRGESGQPLNFGIDMTFNKMPMLDLMVSVEGAFSSYDVSFVPGSIDGVPLGDEIDKTLPYARVGVEASAMLTVFKVPPMVGTFDFFVGGGIGVHVFTPVVTEELLLDNINSADEEVKPEDYVSLKVKPGLHLMAGVKIKPPVFPVGFRVTGKYYIIPGQDDPLPGGFLNVQAGIYFGG